MTVQRSATEDVILLGEVVTRLFCPCRGKSWKFITRRTLISGARFLFGALSEVQSASLCG
jgi:hypothetical protein